MLDGDGIYFRATDGVAHDFRDNETFSVPEGMGFEVVYNTLPEGQPEQAIRLLPEKPVPNYPKG